MHVLYVTGYMSAHFVSSSGLSSVVVQLLQAELSSRLGLACNNAHFCCISGAVKRDAYNIANQTYLSARLRGRREDNISGCYFRAFVSTWSVQNVISRP